ncbi:hypothetical protein SPRG_12173 [Saprolegnia parasitica CBS 223.65]|uniref:Peptidase C1A papain C-terminal domain-containing protein n=1 Tax=Saprolegnia parasitica (strain CBS 223.65) TaxID=695850 RepID=A0A067C892_SAPPC|nr:hypothetical protein SPRG_12173 [Saprolegnia parasitica CBS 223.65]KDO22746.1 hypothetical protein SPRG_12173 [Saprolegnia parasitica CBS 223.65]|eukprot:XP_012206533.1 hypothetical protein SPRG_12173 [Saprolegnia parasitica CBS 223.65]
MKVLTTTTTLLLAITTAMADVCHDHATEASCLQFDCAWCKSAAVKSSCYDPDEASQLPPSIFECARPAPNHGCHFFNTESACRQSKEGGKPCYWCESAAVKSTCYNETEAKQLPPAIFQCEHGRAPVFAHGVTSLVDVTNDAQGHETWHASAEAATTKNGGQCHLFKNEEACTNAHAACAWCASAAVASACYEADEVSKLPPGVFACKTSETSPSHGCHFFNTESACRKGKEGDKPCYWCKSAAVASTCYNEDEAKKLPPAIFQCESGGPTHWALTSVPTSETSRRLLFSHWKDAFDVAYGQHENEAARFAAFVANAALVATHNARGDRPYSLALNAFADSTWAEFQADYLGATPQNCSATHRSVVTATTDVPAAIDWRRVDAVSPVKNQGKCGSCWTFSSTGCLESHNLLTHGKRILLSEQNLVDCAGAFDNHGCNGGLPSHAFEYIKYNGGLDTGATYPYHAKDETCKFDPANVGVRVLDVVNVTSRDETQLKTAVGTVGPVSIAFQVASDFRFYKDGVYDSTECKSGEADVNHAVLAVGYNTTTSGAPYWIVKNSWSATWGMDGYFHIARDKNMCGLADCASYPLL